MAKVAVATLILVALSPGLPGPIEAASAPRPAGPDVAARPARPESKVGRGDEITPADGAGRSQELTSDLPHVRLGGHERLLDGDDSDTETRRLGPEVADVEVAAPWRSRRPGGSPRPIGRNRADSRRVCRLRC